MRRRARAGRRPSSRTRAMTSQSGRTAVRGHSRRRAGARHGRARRVRVRALHRWSRPALRSRAARLHRHPRVRREHAAPGAAARGPRAEILCCTPSYALAIADYVGDPGNLALRAPSSTRRAASATASVSAMRDGSVIAMHDGLLEPSVRVIESLQPIIQLNSPAAPACSSGTARRGPRGAWCRHPRPRRPGTATWCRTRRSSRHERPTVGVATSPSASSRRAPTSLATLPSGGGYTEHSGNRAQRVGAHRLQRG